MQSMPQKDGVLVLHSIRQMVMVYQNKIQFVCYEEGFSDGQFKGETSGDVSSKLPLAHDFTFHKVTGETQALKWHGVSGGGGGPGIIRRVHETNQLQFSSSDEDDENFFNSNQSQRAVKIVRTAKDTMLPQ